MRIRISNQGEPSRIESFEHRTEVRVGRVAANDLQLAERGISSNHARFYFDHSGQLFIEDLGSTNGTFVNGQRIQGAHAISAHDEVYVCHIKVEVARDGEEFPPEPAPAPVQTGRTQMASPDQVDELRRSRAGAAGEIGGGGGGADQGQWNQGQGGQPGFEQSQWGQPQQPPAQQQQSYGHGHWGQPQQGQPQQDQSQWSQQQGQWQQQQGQPSQPGQPGYDQGQWDQQQQGQPGQPGYDQGQWDQQGHDQGQWGQQQQNDTRQGYDQQSQWGPGQDPQQPGYDQGQWGQASSAPDEEIEELEDFEEIEPEPEPDPEPVRGREGSPGRGAQAAGRETFPRSEDAGPPSVGEAQPGGPPSVSEGPPGGGPPSVGEGPPGGGPPSLGGGSPPDSEPPSLGGGPPADGGPPSLGGGPPADGGPPSLGGGPPSLDGGGPPSLGGGPPSLGGGPPPDGGPPSLGGGPPSLDGGGPPSLGGGPPSLDSSPAPDAGPPSLGGGPPSLDSSPAPDAGPPSLGGGPPSGPPPGPPSLGGGPPSLGASPPASDPAPAPSSGPVAAASDQEELDLRPEYHARAAVFHELMSDLGAGPEHPPEDGEKQRKAARVGAKRRMAVIARNDPDLMLDDPATEAEFLLIELFSLGPLTDALADDSVREILIRSPQRIYIDHGHGRDRLERGFSCPAAVSMALHRFAGAHLNWDAAAPWLNHRMPDGTVLRGADASVAPDGPVVVISRPGRTGIGGLSRVGEVSEAVADYLRALLLAQGNVLVCVGDGCEGTTLMSALSHELGKIDAPSLGIVRAGSQIVPPHQALVLDAEPRLTAGPVRLAIEAGSTSLVVHRAEGAGLASALAGRTRGVEQLVLGISAADTDTALATCIEGLALGGYGRNRDELRQVIASTFDVVVVLGRSSRGDENPVLVAEFDASGELSPILSRASADARWQHHRDPAALAKLSERGVTFDPAALRQLGGD